MQKVAVMAGNFKPDRYSYKAFKLLLEKGHQVFPVAPVIKELDGVPVFESLQDIPETVETVTLYMNPRWVEKALPDILAVKPERVIFNPGTESEELEASLEERGIRPLEACTLVLLKTGRFEEV